MSNSRAALLLLMVALLQTGCPSSGPSKPLHRDRAAERDQACADPARPSAYFYPAENRTDYRPDHPDKDGCHILVADHLFCCPSKPRTTDR